MFLWVKYIISHVKEKNQLSRAYQVFCPIISNLSVLEKCVLSDLIFVNLLSKRVKVEINHRRY